MTVLNCASRGYFKWVESDALSKHMVYSQFHLDKFSTVQMTVLTVYVNYMKSDFLKM